MLFAGNRFSGSVPSMRFPNRRRLLERPVVAGNSNCFAAVVGDTERDSRHYHCCIGSVADVGTLRCCCCIVGCRCLEVVLRHSKDVAEVRTCQSTFHRMIAAVVCWDSPFQSGRKPPSTRNLHLHTSGTVLRASGVDHRSKGRYVLCFLPERWCYAFEVDCSSPAGSSWWALS